MPIVTVASGKGGATKTTTAFALADALREMKQEPILLDLDPGASLTVSAGFIPDGQHAVAFLNGTGSVAELSTTTKDGAVIIPGSPALNAGNTDRTETVRWARSLRRAGEDHLVIADTAQGLALPSTRAALLAADYIVVPMQPEPNAIKRSYPDVLALLRIFRGDPELLAEFPLKPILLFAMTKYNSRLALSRFLLDELSSDGVTIAAYIPVSVKAPEAELSGKSVLGFAPNSPVAKGYRDLARTLIAAMNSQKLALSN